MKKIIFLALLFIMTFNLAKSQSEPLDMWVITLSELQLKLKNTKLDVRFILDEHIFTPPKYIPSGQIGRSGFLIGYPFWKFKIFSSTKVNYKGAINTGLRLDFNTLALNKKLIISLQERYFWAINEKARDHYYLIQYLGYKLPNNKTLGILGMGKWNVGKDFNTGVFPIGPCIGIHDTKNLTAKIAIMKDVFHKNLWVTYASLHYKIDFSEK